MKELKNEINTRIREAHKAARETESIEIFEYYMMKAHAYITVLEMIETREGEKTKC